MIDMTSTIIPRSDQMNSDDLIVGPRTIKITKVSANPSSTEQPISIYFEGDENKPWKPCKSMRRVLVTTWGRDATAYSGRLITLYRDPEVKWGGLAVGGLRISHMSHIEEPMTMALTETRAARKPFTVRPLAEENPIDAYAKEVGRAIKEMAAADLMKWWDDDMDRRSALNIPTARLNKMADAVAAKIKGDVA